MTILYRLRLHLFLTTLLATSASLLAQVTAVSNVGQTFAFDQIVGQATDFDFYQAFNFTTGSTSTTLASITISAGASTATASGFSMSLYSGFSSGPTGLLASLNGSSTPAGVGVSYSYVPASSITLAPGTTYWVLATALGMPSNTYYSIQGTSSTSEDSSVFSGWSIGNTEMFTTTAGASWFSSATIPMFSVQVAAIPEPSESAFVFGTVGLLAFVALKQRRHRNPKEANQSSATPPSVTDRAGARSAPAGGLAHL